MEDILRNENDPDIYLKVKEALLGFVMTLEVSMQTSARRVAADESLQSYSYSTISIHSLILRLFEKYVNILEIKFGKRFENVSFQRKYW